MYMEHELPDEIKAHILFVIFIINKERRIDRSTICHFEDDRPCLLRKQIHIVDIYKIIIRNFTCFISNMKTNFAFLHI